MKRERTEDGFVMISVVLVSAIVLVLLTVVTTAVQGYSNTVSNQVAVVTSRNAAASVAASLDETLTLSGKLAFGLSADTAGKFTSWFTMAGLAASSDRAPLPQSFRVVGCTTYKQACYYYSPVTVNATSVVAEITVRSGCTAGGRNCTLTRWKAAWRKDGTAAWAKDYATQIPLTQIATPVPTKNPYLLP
jgi:hypothetical protein